MFAVIQTGGKQYLVKKGDKLQVELLESEKGKNFTIKEVLMISDGKSASTKVGAPFVSGASITATILEHGKGEKVRIYKMRRRKRYRRTRGHRQQFTEIEIGEIKV